MTRAEKLKRLRAALDGIMTMVEPWLPPDPPPSRRLALASYFYPGALWDKAIAKPQAGLMLINPSSGPGTMVSTDYLAQLVRAQVAGISVLGYVSTSYGNRSATLVDLDIDRYFSFYPTINGIFLDEAQDDRGTTDLPYYTARSAKIRAKAPGALVCMNPGAETPETYAAIADVLLTFEGTPAAYRLRKPVPWEMARPASKFWHIIHSCSLAELDEMIALAAARNIGRLHITDDSGSNPYDTLPSYFDALCSKIS